MAKDPARKTAAANPLPPDFRPVLVRLRDGSAKPAIMPKVSLDFAGVRFADGSAVEELLARQQLEMVTFQDESLKEDATIGMTLYLLLLWENRQQPIHCFRINRQEEGISGLIQSGGVWNRAVVHYGAVRKIIKVEDPARLDALMAEAARAAEPLAAKGGNGGSATGVTGESRPFGLLDLPSGAAGNLVIDDEEARPRPTSPQEERYQRVAQLLATTGHRGGRHRLGEIMVQVGVISDNQLQQALTLQRTRQRGMRLGEVLQGMGLMDGVILSLHLAHQLRLPFLRLDQRSPDPATLRLLSREMAGKLGAVPVEISPTGHVVLATPNPWSLDTQEAAFVMGRAVTVAVCPEGDLGMALANWYADTPGAAAPSATVELSTLMSETLDEEQEPELPQSLVSAEGAAPVIRLANHLVLEAVKQRASDIHITPEADFLRIAYRVDGTLVDQTRLKKGVAVPLVARFKVLGGMNIAERRLPQDGRIHAVIHHQEVDIRVSCLPATHGETIVMRLLYSQKEIPPLEKLGLLEEDVTAARKALRLSHGLILVTGPTGSGKSTTLGTFLNHIRTREERLHILTVEDPVESDLAGVTQVQVNHKIGLTFPRVLRNVLRHDPDVVMVGEIRDEETARIAVQAALTGHLVLSTLHTNDALGTISRLTNMGVESYLLGSALSLVMAQRLVRRLCDCATQRVPSREELLLFHQGGINLVPGTRLGQPTGCDRCRKTGYRGRLLIYELLTVGSGLQAAIAEKRSLREMTELAREEGFQPLGQFGLLQVLEGHTTLAEVLQHWTG